MKDPNYNTEFCVCSECPACRKSLKELGVFHHRGEIMLDENYKPINDRAPMVKEDPIDKLLAKQEREKALAAARKERQREREKLAAAPKPTKVKPPRAAKGHRRTQAEWRKHYAAQRVMVDGKMVHPDAPHGTITGYSSYSCRCPKCSAENTKSCAARKARLKEKERA